MICSNYDKEMEECKYHQALFGSLEESPTGMDEISGDCKAMEQYDDWIEMEPDDCDMLNLAEDDDD